MAQGLDKIPLRIPHHWDPAWFERFVREVLALADVRNATGDGIEITGQSDNTATLTVSQDIQDLLAQPFVLAQPSGFLENERTLAGEDGVVSIVDGGPDANVTVTLLANGINLGKLTQFSGYGLVGNPQNTLADMQKIAPSGNGEALAVEGGEILWTATPTWGDDHTWLDDAAVVLGTGGDLTIVHDGTDSTLTNITGNLVLDNTGSGHIYLSATTGNVRLDRDSEELQLGASQDLRLYHDGTDCFLRADTGLLRLNIGANTALQFNSSRAWGVDGANYGTVGQVLTSNGSSAAPGWTTPAGGGGIGTLDAEIMADTPTAFWKLDEASGNPQDSSGNGFHLTSTTNLTYQYAPIIPSLPTTSFLRFNATTGQASYTGVLGTSPPLTGSWTYEIVVNVDTFTSNNCGLCRMGAAGETAATNFQVLPYLASTGALAIYWESGSGVDRDNITTTNLVEGKSYHLVFQKDGTNDTLTFYVNGIKVTTLAYLNANEPTGGTDAAMSTGIGATVGGATAPMTCGYAAFYNGVLLTPARIAIHARAAGLYGF